MLDDGAHNLITIETAHLDLIIAAAGAVTRFIQT